MEVIHSRVAGLDVHKETVVACVRIMHGASPRRETRSFQTTTADLEALSRWLQECGCAKVAMEATGVYWKPVWAILSDGPFELILANAAHIKNVPGRKTDVSDAAWIADLVACGLIRGSFVPGQAVQDFRALLRTRKQLSREQTRHVQRLQKTLEAANIKLDSVISDIMGASGRRIVEAIAAGVKNPAKLANLASSRLKATPKQLYDALHGRVTAHHRFLLKLHLDQYDALAKSAAAIDEEVAAAILRMDEEAAEDKPPFRALIDLLCQIPGIGALAAQTILSEIDRDMSRFPTAGHLVAWAGLCPCQNESGGKRKSSGLRKGAPWLKTLIVECAWAAKNKKDSYFKAQYHRLKARRGPQKAICAVAASLLTTVYHMLKDGACYKDLGAGWFDRRPAEAKAKRLVAKLNTLGFAVQLQPLSEAA